MERRVNRKAIDLWVRMNGPQGLARLAAESGISASTWSYARLGTVPKKYATRRRMFEFLKVSEAELFPLAATNGKAQAS